MSSLQNRKIRWGIIGLGNIANKFAQDLLTLKDVELYAVASRSQFKARAFAEKYGAKNHYNSYEALTNDEEIDAVYIATPHSFHKEHTLLCLENNIPVLCEKPFAMNLTEVKEMITKAKEKKVLLMEALWTAFLPHYKYVRAVLEDREFGEVLKIEADFGFKATQDPQSHVVKKSLGGGSLLDIGIYPVFLALSILGVPKKIDAQATYFKNGADSSCDIIFTYNDERKANLKSTFLKETPTKATICCEKGIIVINGRFHEPNNIVIKENNDEEYIRPKVDTLGYNYEIEHFNQLLRTRKTESPIMSFEFSESLIQTLDNVRHKINLIY